MRIACKSEYDIIFHLQYPYIKCHQNVLPFPYISFLLARHHQKTKENKFALHTQNMCFWHFWEVPSFWTRISFTLSRLQLKTLKTQIRHFGFWWKKKAAKCVIKHVRLGALEIISAVRSATAFWSPVENFSVFSTSGNFKPPLRDSVELLR